MTGVDWNKKAPDHSGLWVDVVEQIEPAESFWDKYRV
tara:strand:- start:2030 stop:2140 length:111 start_codon:yes stop_codon:yes gene_type:complete